MSTAVGAVVSPRRHIGSALVGSGPAEAYGSGSILAAISLARGGTTRPVALTQRASLRHVPATLEAVAGGVRRPRSLVTFATALVVAPVRTTLIERRAVHRSVCRSRVRDVGPSLEAVASGPMGALSRPAVPALPDAGPGKVCDASALASGFFSA